MSIIKLVLVTSFMAFAAAAQMTFAPTTNGPRKDGHDDKEDHNRPPHESKAPVSPRPTVEPTVAPSVYSRKPPNARRQPRARPTRPTPPPPTPLPTFAPTALPTLPPTLPPTTPPTLPPTLPPTPPPTTPPTLPPTKSPTQLPLCFSGTSTVQVLQRGVTAIKNVRLGDRILNAEGKYDTVYSFGHYSPAMEAEFVQIKVAGHMPLELSREHMLFVNGALLPALAVAMGDNVQLYNGATAKVVKITNVTRRGVYNPYTLSGTVVVNDIAASCYNEIPNTIMGGWYTHMFKHINLAHHRLICKMSPAYCLIETYNEHGNSAWAAIPHALIKWSNRQNVWTWSTVLVLRMLLFHLPVYGIELILTCNSKLGFYLVIAVVSFFAVCNTKKNGRKTVAT